MEGWHSLQFLHLRRNQRLYTIILQLLVQLMLSGVVSLVVGQCLNARLLELIMRQMLVVSVDADLPLLQLANHALLVLGRDP